MTVSVNEALRRVGEPFPFAWEGELKPETFAGDPVKFAGKAKLSGTYVYDGKTFRVDADAEASYETTCARCGEPMTETLRFSFTEHFVRSVYKTPDDELYPYEGEKLDLFGRAAGIGADQHSYIIFFTDDRSLAAYRAM